MRHFANQLKSGYILAWAAFVKMASFRPEPEPKSSTALGQIKWRYRRNKYYQFLTSAEAKSQWYQLTTRQLTHMQSSAEQDDLLLFRCCLSPGIRICFHHPEYVVAGQSFEYSVHHLEERTGAHHQSVDRLWAMLWSVVANQVTIQQNNSRQATYHAQQQCPLAQPQIPDPSQGCLHLLKTEQHNRPRYDETINVHLKVDE